MDTGSCPLQLEDSVEVKDLSNGWLLYFPDLSALTPGYDSGSYNYDQFEFTLQEVG